MPVAELAKLIDELDEENYSAVLKFVLYLGDQQSKQTHAKDTSKRIGAGKGMFEAPEDLDECNEEIAQLFGVA